MYLIQMALAVVLVCGLSQSGRGDAIERMRMEKLRATHEKVEALKSQLRTVALPSGYTDTRTLLHVHSAFSHDSRGTIDEIVAAARTAGVRVVMFTEHPASHYNYINDGHRGWKDNVLLIPGAETEGFLAYPRRNIQDQKYSGPQQFTDLVRGADGLIFLSHLEERMDWDIDGITGNEIYNTHADFKEEQRFITALRSPLTLLGLASAVRQFPQEMFAALQDYPADYLKRWDQLCQKSRHTGVSANDAHHNQAYRARLTDDGKVLMHDALDKKLAELDPEKIPLLKPLTSGKKPGDVIFEIDLDPYERSFRHVSTHLLLPEITEASIWDALKEGRAYVAFDWIADPTGFVFRADRAADTWPMGAEVPGPAGVRLRAEAPLEGHFKLLCDGTAVLEQDGNAIDVPVEKAGNYRVEVWLTLAGEPRPWILSNPIYIRAQ